MKDVSFSIHYPRFCDIVLSNRCMLHCKMCTAWKCGSDSPGLTFDQAKRFIDSLRDLVENPSLEINIMGGEPFLIDWCLDLCDYIGNKGFTSIISTNACLIDEDFAKCIVASRLNVLAISLESLRPHVHDFLRGEKGVLEKVLRAIDYLKRHKHNRKDNLALTILTIIMEKNLDDILELTHWVNNEDAFEQISFLALQETGLVHPRNNWFRRPEYNQLWPQNTATLHRVMDELIMLKKRGFKIWNPYAQLEAFKKYYVDPDVFMKETDCHIHDYILDLDETGTIYLSGYVLGNVQKDDLRTLWFSSRADAIRAKINQRGAGRRCCVINFMVAFEKEDEYHFRSHLRSGEYYMAGREFDRAAGEFMQILQNQPGNQEVRRNAGMCYAALGQHDKAIREFSLLNGMGEEVRRQLGICYMATNQLEKAAQEYRFILESNPCAGWAYYELGKCHRMENQFGPAIEMFRKALDLEPENTHIHQELGVCYAAVGDLSRARQEYHEVLRNPSCAGWAYYELGKCHRMENQFGPAIEMFRKALDLEPENTHIHQELGVCYYELKQVPEAVQAFQNALRITNENVYARQGLGLCFLVQGRVREARKEFEYVLGKVPHDVVSLLGLGQLYYRQRNYELALKVFGDILAIDGNQKEAAYYNDKIRNSLFYKMGRFWNILKVKPKD